MYKLIKYFGFFLPYCIFIKLFMRYDRERKINVQHVNGDIVEVDAWLISGGLFVIRPFGKQLELEIKQTEANIRNLERKLEKTGSVRDGDYDSYGKEGECYE